VRPLILLAALLAACAATTPAPAPRAEPPTPLEPYGLEAGTPCGSACAALARLRCPESMPNASGESCVTICNRVQGSGIADLRPLCVAKAGDVAAARACGVRCAP